jgi:hypothetical protein
MEYYQISLIDQALQDLGDVIAADWMENAKGLDGKPLGVDVSLKIKSAAGCLGEIKRCQGCNRPDIL